MSSHSIAFIGTGVMGRSMAGHLLKAGHKLHIHNRTKAKAEKVRDIERTLNGKAESITVAALAGKVDVLEDRVTRLETEFEHLPSRDTTHRLEVAMGDLRTELSALSERIRPVSAMADRIQQAMIDQVKFG